MIFVPFEEPRSPFFIYFARVESLVFDCMIGRKPNKAKIQHFHSRYYNWPEVRHPIQHKATILHSLLPDIRYGPVQGC